MYHGALTGQDVRFKTPSAGLLRKTAARGVLRDLGGFDFGQIPSLKFWLETKNDAYLVKNGSDLISRQIDRVQGFNLDQAVAASKPLYLAAPVIFPRHDASNFDMFSGDQFLRSAGTPSITSAQSGHVFFSTYVVPLVDGEWLWSVSDTTRDDNFFGLMTYDSGGGDFRFAFYHVISGGTPTVAYGTTDITSGGAFIVELHSQGTNMSMKVNGAFETLTYVSGTPNGNWFGDMLTPNCICVNHLVRLSASQAGALSAFGHLLVVDGTMEPGINTLTYNKMASEIL